MSQCHFKVVSGRDGSSPVVLQLETEVTQQPEEGREGVDEFLRVVAVLPVEHSCQLDYETETVDGLLVNTAHAVVDELRTEEQGKQEDLQIRAFPLLQRPQALSVDDQTVLSLKFDEFGPHPQSLRAGIDGMAYTEPVLPPKQHSVQDVTLPRTVLPCHCHHVQGPTAHPPQGLDGSWRDEGV